MKKYNENIFLSLISSSLVQITEDNINIGDVVTATNTISSPSKSCTVVGQIVGYKDLLVYRSCIFCNGQLHVNESTNETSICTLCSACVKVSKCPRDVYCKIMLKTEDKYLELIAFLKHLTPLLSSNSTTNLETMHEDILQSQLITVKYSCDNSMIEDLSVN